MRNAECGTRNPNIRIPGAVFRTPRSDSGFTLVEVLLTALILGIGLTVLLASLSTCLRTLKLAQQYEQVAWVIGAGELAHPDPLTPSTDVEEDFAVEPDSAIAEGYTFERTVEPKTDAEKEKDRLYKVRVRVSWGEETGGERPHEELVRYVWERGP
jgi:prepilin-type N-terminal cleavage/methylation domain-containing protein